MLRRALVVLVLFAGASSFAFPCDAGCTSVLVGEARRNIDGQAARGGETICLVAGAVHDLFIHDFAPDAGTVTIRSCDGTVLVNGGSNVAISINDSSGIRVTGEEADGGRSLIVDGANASTSMGIAFGGCSQRVEIDHLEVFDTSYTSLRHGSEDQRCAHQSGLIIRDNFFHDVGGEGLFVGMNRDDNPFTWANVEIARNRIERPGFQGIKVGQVQNVSIHDNVIVNAGVSRTPGEDTGFPVGPQVTGRIERNVLLGATSWCMGLGGKDLQLTVQNNLLVDCQGGGVVLGGVGHGSSRHLDVRHNTIVRPNGPGALDWSAGDGGGTFANNLVVDLPTNTRAIDVKAIFTVAGNLAVQSDGGDFSTRDTGSPFAQWKLAATSAAVNAGVPSGVVDDLEGLTRDAMPDVGAHEFGAMLAIDAGVPDAGHEEEDAGEVDAGAASADAGPVAADAGTPENDAGMIDADAGTGSGGATGGCGCSSTPMVLALMSLVFSRRRRSA